MSYYLFEKPTLQHLQFLYKILAPMNKRTSFLVGLLTGAAAGAVLGLLYAPDKGINTRERLSYLLSKYKNQLEDLLKELSQGGAEATSEAKEEGQKVINDVKEKAEKLLGDVESLMEQIKQPKNPA
jgi:gas vesicle protein